MKGNKINVVKIGGNVIDDPSALNAFLDKFARLEGLKILVHGGGKEATRMSGLLGIETQMIEGRRITDKNTLEVVTMVYAGLINKRIIARLQSLGCNAIGFTGADGNLIPATRRKPNPIDYGFVGDINPHKVNTNLIDSLLREDYAIVACAICHDEEGSLLNCNADSVASALAIATSKIAPTRLTYCFEKNGVLADIDDGNSVIPLITQYNFQTLKDAGIIAMGMIPKISNALASAAEGVEEVRICNADAIDSTGGTIIKLGKR